jgi:PIN domain nuclease of toxin-antitoxin system
MRLLLDAHALLWWVTGSSRMSEVARRAISDPINDVIVSVGSLWEMAIKRTIRKLDFPFDFETVLSDEGFELMPISHEHLRTLETLPLHHGDPFDRLLIAQSMTEGCPIITNDSAFSRYAVNIVW